MTAPPALPADAQAAQTGLAYLASRDVSAAFAQLDLTHLSTSLPPFKQAVLAVASRYGAASATLAVRQYLQARDAAGIRGTFIPLPRPVVAAAKVAASIDWATGGLWTAQPDAAAALTKVRGVTEKLVLDTGRATVIDNVERDRQARGWARIPEPSACYFCALLATRGAVYKSETVGFRSHDHCRCHAEPVFTAYEAPARVREWQALYSDSTGGLRGSRTVQTAWRQAYTAAYGT